MNIIIIVAVGLLLIPLIVWLKKKTHERHLEIATQLDFEYFKKKKLDKEIKKQNFTSLRGGLNLNAKHLLHKSYDSFDLSIFEFKSPNRNKHTTLFLFHSETQFPNFNLYPVANKSDMPLFKYQKVEFEKFHILTTKYCLKSTDPREAQKAITKTAIKQLENTDSVLIEARSNYFLIFRTDLNFNITDISNFLPNAILLFESFGLEN